MSDMQTLPLGVSAYDRRYGRAVVVELVNRFFEQDPTNTAEGSALLTRPATLPLVAGGSGPIRGTFSQAGMFGGDLFFVSDNTLFRWDGTTRTAITGTITDGDIVEFAFVKGPDYEHLFISDGTLLQLYRGTARATGTLTLTPGTPPDIASQTLQIGTVYYQWTAGSPSGTATGGSGDPFEVAVGADDAESLENMAEAINGTGIPGTTYSATITTENTQVAAIEWDATTLTIRARERGTSGNSIDTLVTGAHLAWGAATLTGGGVEALVGVEIPDGSGASSVASLGGFCVVVTANSAVWYFVRPGEITISALDFYEAAEEPDEVVAVRQVGDYLYFFGQSSIEVWYLTGNVTAAGDAFLPVDGRAFSIGVVPGTIVKIKDFVMFVGTDNIVYRMAGEPTPVRNHGISEQIRLARTYERENA